MICCGWVENAVFGMHLHASAGLYQACTAGHVAQAVQRGICISRRHTFTRPQHKLVNTGLYAEDFTDKVSSPSTQLMQDSKEKTAADRSTSSLPGGAE